MRRTWTDDEVRVCADGILEITRQNKSGNVGQGLNEGIKAGVASKIGRTEAAVSKMMRNIAWMLNQGSDSAVRSSIREGDAPSGQRQTQIERVLKSMA